MQITIDRILRVSVRHTYLRHGRFYYQRAIPLDLADRYPARLIKQNLCTTDPILAAQMVASLDLQHEIEWERLRRAPQSLPLPLPILPEKRHLLASSEDLTILRFATRTAVHAHSGLSPNAYPPVEPPAPSLEHHSVEDVVSDALDIYLKSHHKAHSESIRKASTIAVKGFIALRGDKPISGLTRADGRAYINAELARGVSTATVRRRLTALNAIFNSYTKERELDRKSPFSGHKIAGEGEDGKKRQPLSPDNLKSLQARCRAADDDLRWIVALLSDTGARLAEMTGLALDDLNIDAAIPHVVITPHPWRTLKNRESERTVPLVGASLWAAQRLKACAKEGQQFAFPRYIKGGTCNATAASAALAKWIRSTGMNHTPHELRHTLRDRLREVQCPEAITDAIGGWALTSVGQGYGNGYSLKVMHEWLARITD